MVGELRRKKEKFSTPPRANPAQDTSQTWVFVRPAAHGDIGCLKFIVDGLVGDGLELLVLVSISLRSLSLLGRRSGRHSPGFVGCDDAGGAQAMSIEGREGTLLV